MNKTELIKIIKEKTNWYAIPRQMTSRPKSELESLWFDIQKLGLTKEVVK